ncbi:hypothetical protein Bxe_A1973 [Paraburkholderia xenovorans LB400]|jgi:hypothetical protein|uniref:Lipoprotein n=2 Tax=Paraburkholderia TaxID=1822464 RepID=Q13Y46_PARXL|nr:hypothetical protein Bxe_A1973 [Paraburkholderia xenovorans LB400]
MRRPFDAGTAQRLLYCQRRMSLGGRVMKTSTLLIMVTLSASCFAAPVRTAPDSTSASSLAERANAAPVAPAAPDVAATDDNRPQQWQHIALPKSRHLDRSFMGQNEHLQT